MTQLAEAMLKESHSGKDLNSDLTKNRVRQVPQAYQINLESLATSLRFSTDQEDLARRPVP